MSLIESILQFPNPNTPDLGCFVRRKHEFQSQSDVDFQNLHVEFNPSIDFNPAFHQTYFRVSCGEAAFFQRCMVHMTSNAQLPPSVIESFPPGFVLGGDFTPHPSDWNRYPTQYGERFYWFFGQHRNPATTTWQGDALVGHSYDLYENGTLSIVRYDDTGGDRDFDDLVLEIAIVGRRSWGDLVQAVDQVALDEKIKKQGIPRLQALLKERGK